MRVRERELTVKALDQLILSVLVHHGWRTWWLDSEWNRKGIPTWFYFGSKIAIEYWSELACLVFHEQKVLFFGFALWINRCYRWFCQWHISLLLPCVCFPLIQTSYLAYSLISTLFLGNWFGYRNLHFFRNIPMTGKHKNLLFSVPILNSFHFSLRPRIRFWTLEGYSFLWLFLFLFCQALTLYVFPPGWSWVSISDSGFCLE
jgi:hypothetical protein